MLKKEYGLGIWDPEKTYSWSRLPGPEVKKAPDPGSATLLFSLAGRYDNPIPTLFLAPIDGLKIPAQIT